ncbi:hypothetical protein GOV12_08280 [Candidatus Pacearchaeota archaeon]|nr:hypothetical protein [Candidatus Pacearchaeota archaeon]
MYKNKKGQAAMEFLMTYGWAILAAVIAIGVLAYFGVFSPGKYITGNAVVNPPFYITAANAKASHGADGGVQIALKNNGGENYDIHNIVIGNCGNYTGAPDAILADTTSTITIDCTVGNHLDVGDNIKGDITITYQKVGVAVDLTSTGTVAQKVVA